LSLTEINLYRSNGIAGPFLVTAPAITNHPVGNTNLVATDTWSLKAYGLGTHPLSFQWYSNGVALVDGGEVIGATNQILTLTNLPAGYSGIYTVTITNTAGSVTSSGANVLVSTVTPQ